MVHIFETDKRSKVSGKRPIFNTKEYLSSDNVHRDSVTPRTSCPRACNLSDTAWSIALSFSTELGEKRSSLYMHNIFKFSLSKKSLSSTSKLKEKNLNHQLTPSQVNSKKKSQPSTNPLSSKSEASPSGGRLEGAPLFQKNLCLRDIAGMVDVQHF